MSRVFGAAAAEERAAGAGSHAPTVDRIDPCCPGFNKADGEAFVKRETDRYMYCDFTHLETVDLPWTDQQRFGETDSLAQYLWVDPERLAPRRQWPGVKSKMRNASAGSRPMNRAEGGTTIPSRSNSQRTTRSEGSMISRTVNPPPMACGKPPGTNQTWPGRTGTGSKQASMAAMSCSITIRCHSSGVGGC